MAVAACGAVYVSRFATLDPRRVTGSMAEALEKKGFTFVEVVAPCPELYGRRNKLGRGVDMMRFYRDHTEVQHEAPLADLDVEFQKPFTLGRFVDQDRPDYEYLRDESLRKKLGDAYRKPVGEEDAP